MPKAEREHAEKNITVRYPLAVDARIHRIQEVISKRTGDVPISISLVMNEIVRAGLPFVEKKFEVVKFARKFGIAKQVNRTSK